ncbi:deoxyguanosinetriphosphate triphosphohydrolase [Lentisalinibacter salinarum]|uniref:deoxyguanosinetriphosphate triphosphohydrolase n=1 Tax=Lentisalinibacter salinarum TaxID=2992239 RepID=UPI0038650BFC
MSGTMEYVDMERADDGLLPGAARESESPGRRHDEPPPVYRGEYQRDRDRIIHASAFRRLVYKTQVFVNHEGDLYRTRLTHSLEVAQIARSVAHTLGLNETLAEAICLAHDLGHTPFGHAGQDALNECMRDYGGFEHNLQSLRVVDELEEKYAEFAGLNLMYETREGILKHCSARHARDLGELGRRFLERRQPGLEAQLANLADEIAYNNHDVDDGLRAGLLGVDMLRAEPLFAAQHDEVLARYPGLDGRRLIHEVIRRMINRVVTDLIRETAGRLRSANPRSIDEVRNHEGPLVAFGDEIREQHLSLKRFLHANLYRHHRVLGMTLKARRVVEALFAAYMDEPRLMPAEFATAARCAGREHGDAARARVVADYVAGMTDRYAIAEHERLTDPAVGNT